MRTCLCACGATITMTGPMETWDGPMLAHVRSPRHREWSQPKPHIYEEHLDSLLAGVGTSVTRGTAEGPGSVSTSGKAA